MHKLELTLACGRYDRTQPLLDGRVQPEGVNLTFLPLRPGETFWRMLNHGEFDVSEMSLSSYTILRSEGDTRFIAIPVFPSRVFRHSALYVRSNSGIEKPEDLEGKRVGVGDYQMTAAVWVRGLLTHEHGVAPEDIVWVTGKPIRSIKPPDGIRLQSIPPDTTLETLLERGEIDALMSVMIPDGLGKTVRRLFRDPRTVEIAYYNKTRIFPIMHTLVLKTSLYEAKPWLAATLYRAFCQARDLAHAGDVRHGRIDGQPSLGGARGGGHARDLRTANLGLFDRGQPSDPRRSHEPTSTNRSFRDAECIVDELFVPNISPGLLDYLRATGERVSARGLDRVASVAVRAFPPGAVQPRKRSEVVRYKDPGSEPR